MKRVQSALAEVEGVERVQVVMPDRALVSGSAAPDALIAAVKGAGYGAAVRGDE